MDPWSSPGLSLLRSCCCWLPQLTLSKHVLQGKALTGSMMMCDAGSSQAKAMLRSERVVERSHFCCLVPISSSPNATLTGMPGGWGSRSI